MKSFVYPMMSPLCFSLVAKILQDRKILDWLYSTGYSLAHLPHLKDFPRIKVDNFNLTRVLLNWVPLIKLKPKSSPPDECPIRREKNTFRAKKTSTLNQPNCLKCKKMLATKLWLILVLNIIVWEGGESFLDWSQSKVKQKTFSIQDYFRKLLQIRSCIYDYL